MILGSAVRILKSVQSMAKSHSSWFRGVLALQFRLGRTFVGFSLFRINLGMCWVILYCNLKDVRPTYRQSERHTYWYTTKLCCVVGTALLRKKKQTNPLFEDENHNKVTSKRRDFYSANIFRNLKAAFNSDRAIISIFFFFFALTYSILDDFAASCLIITIHCLFQRNQPLYIGLPSHFSFSSFQRRVMKRAGWKRSI